RSRREHRQWPRLRPRGGQTNPVAGARRDVAKPKAALRVGLLRGDRPARGIEERHLRARSQMGDVDLLNAAVCAERRLSCTRGAHECDREASGTKSETEPPGHVGTK